MANGNCLSLSRRRQPVQRRVHRPRRAGGKHSGGLCQRRHPLRHQHLPRLGFRIHPQQLSSTPPTSTPPSPDTLHQNQYRRHLRRSDPSATSSSFSPAINISTEDSTQPAPRHTSQRRPISRATSPLPTAFPEQRRHLHLNVYLLSSLDPSRRDPGRQQVCLRPAFNAPSLKLLSYLPKIDPSFDTNDCGHVTYAIPYQHSDNEFVTRVD